MTEPVFKHYCRVCKKGFGCGRALGGHMRAHGIGDENLHIDDDDVASDWDVGGNNNQPPGHKRMYALRTNTNRNKSCRTCENCGKEFSSWKSFLEHGKCTSADAESFLSPPCSEDEDETTQRGCNNWSKGKRSRRAATKVVGHINPSTEEEDLANCLVMLSNARVEPFIIAETEESCASAGKDEEEQRRNVVTANNRALNENNKAKGIASNKGLFECKACKKVFNSHQALGGHRASHKKVKGCFASKLDDVDESVVEEDVITNDDYFSLPSKSTHQQYQPHHGQVSHQSTLSNPSKRKSKVHECSICHRVFSSGQALGGHKRCHWLTSSSSQDTNPIVKFHTFQDPLMSHNIHQRPPKFNFSEPLDLNLPAPNDQHEHHGGAGRGHECRPQLSFEMPTEIYLQPPWVSTVHTNENNDNNNKINMKMNGCSSSMVNHHHLEEDDEAESKVKLAKLSDLKDMNLVGGSNPWLQVGIGSSTSNNNINVGSSHDS